MYNTDKEELQYYRDYFKSINGFAYVLNIDPYRVSWISNSPILQHLSRDSAAEIIKNGMFAPALSEEDLDLRESVTNGIKTLRDDPNINWGGVFRFIKDDKTPIWMVYTASHLTKDNNGNVIKVACIGIPLDSLFYTPSTIRIFHQYCRKQLNKEVVDSLTERQKQVLILMGKGKLRKEIAAELNLSIGTIDDHKKALYKKLDCNGIGQLAVQAHVLGLIPL